MREMVSARVLWGGGLVLVGGCWRFWGLVVGWDGGDREMGRQEVRIGAGCEDVRSIFSVVGGGEGRDGG